MTRHKKEKIESIVKNALRIAIFVFLLILDAGVALGGQVMFVEIPGDMTEAQAAGGDAAVAGRLHDAVAARTGGGQPALPGAARMAGQEPRIDAIVIYTKNGVPVLPDAAAARAAGRRAALAQNSITFTYNSPDAPWSAQELDEIKNCIQTAEPLIREIYGPPFYQNTVNVFKTASSWYAGYYNPSSNEIALTSADCSTLVHETLHAFRDDDIVYADTYEEGMVRAAEVEIMTRLQDAWYWNFEHGYTIDSHFEMYNIPDFYSCRDGKIFKGAQSLYLNRYQLSGFAWWKVYFEDNAFLKRFNETYATALRTDYGLRSDAARLKNLAAQVAPATVEGLPFSSWYDSKHIFNAAPASGYQVQAVVQDMFIDIRAFYRDGYGNESALENANTRFEFFDINGAPLAQTTQTTSSYGTIGIFAYDYIPSDYHGRYLLRVTMDTPGGRITRDVFSMKGQTSQNEGFFGLVTNMSEGTVTVEPLSAPGTVISMELDHGMFRVPQLYGVKGTFRITYTGPDTRTASVIITKDAAPYFVSLTAAEPPQPPETPALLSPANGAATRDTTPEFTWQNTAGAGGVYDLVISMTADFSQIVFEANSLSSNAYTLVQQLPQDGYYWRVRARGANGVAGEYTAPFRFTVDTMPPSAQITINNDAAYTNSPRVTLNIQGLDVAFMQFSNDGIHYYPESPAPYASAYEWTMAAGDGDKNVYARFYDAAGNISTGKDRITIDTTPPAGAFVFTAGAYTAGGTATIDSRGIVGALTMRFSNDGVTYTSPITISQYYEWALAPGDGPRTVYAMYMDAAGNTLNTSTTITVDTTAPSTPAGVSDGGDTSADGSAIWQWQIAEDAGSGVAGYIISIGTTPGGDDVISRRGVGLDTTFTKFNLPAGAAYYATVWAVDAAGNAGAAAASDGITVTATPERPLTEITYIITGTGWQIISVPGAPETVAANTAIMFYTYDPATETYTLADPAGLEPGSACFINPAAPATLTANTDLDTGGEIMIPLQAGWNAVGNPFNASLPLAGIIIRINGRDLTLDDAIRRGIIQPPATVSNGQYAGMESNGALAPWSGLWLYSAQPGILIIRAS